MKKAIQTETTFNRSMGIVKEIENIFRKETRRGWLSYLLVDMTATLGN